MSELPEYVLEREFKAPRALAWKAWTDPKILQRWYGPGVETTIHQFDLKPGGVWLNEMNWGGKSNYSKMEFKEVVEEEKLVWHHYSCTDAQWNSVANPMMADWPRLLLTTVVFIDHGDKTLIRLSQVPYEATDAEVSCFAEAMANMDKGWGSGYMIMDEIFEEMLS